MTFSLFCALKTHFRTGRHENKEKRLCYFGLRIFLPIQLQLLAIENPKNPKIDFPVCAGLRHEAGELRVGGEGRNRDTQGSTTIGSSSFR
jgi:hypothetical protein